MSLRSVVLVAVAGCGPPGAGAGAADPPARGAAEGAAPTGRVDAWIVTGRPRRFGMHFFADHGVAGGYEYEPLWAAIRGLDPATAAVSLDEADVVAYEVDGEPSACVSLRVTRGAAGRLQAKHAEVREDGVLVTVDGAPLYAAREYPIIGAAALRYPVVHLEAIDRCEIKVCSNQGAAMIGGGDEALARRIDRPELRALFAGRGVLREVKGAGRWRSGG